MSTIVTRAGKGTTLTWAEADANFTNLNTDKIETTAIGVTVQAYDADLTAIAGLTSAADKGIQFTGAGTAATYDLTTAGKALLDDASAGAQRTTLGVGTADSPEFAGVNLGHATDTTLARVSPGVMSVEGKTVAVLNSVQAFAKAQSGVIVSLSDGATITPDFSLGNNFAVSPSLGGNRTLANPTNLVAGQSGVVYLPQDGTGSRTLTLGWGWPSAGVTLSTVAGTVDALAYYVAAAASATVTISNATPGVVTWNGHGLLNGQKIQLTTTGALPTGLSPSTTYYVKYVDANTFQLSSTIGGASINTSSAGSGVHTCTAVTIQASLTKGVM